MRKDVKITLIIITLTILATSSILIMNKENIQNNGKENYGKPAKTEDLGTGKDESYDEAQDALNEEGKGLVEGVCYIDCGDDKDYCSELCNSYPLQYSTSMSGLESCYAQAETYCTRIGLEIFTKIDDDICCCWNCTA